MLQNARTACLSLPSYKVKPVPAGRRGRDGTNFVPGSDQSLLDVERRTILDALELHQGNRMQTARHLGLKWAALNRRCKKLGIDVKKRG